MSIHQDFPTPWRVTDAPPAQAFHDPFSPIAMFRIVDANGRAVGGDDSDRELLTFIASAVNRDRWAADANLAHHAEIARSAR